MGTLLVYILHILKMFLIAIIILANFVIFLTVNNVKSKILQLILQTKINAKLAKNITI